MPAHAPDRLFRTVVAVTAVAAPALHSATDLLEWASGGFSPAMLWLNYLAFLPMSWLLLGFYAIHDRKPGGFGLLGAVLYGASFTYFAHTTLYTLAADIPTYEALWQQLGRVYTAHGALMVAGGLLFAASVWRAAELPRPGVALFAGGLVVNLLLAVLPGPELLQTLGSLLRNVGLVAMGLGVLSGVSNRGLPDRAVVGGHGGDDVTDPSQ